MTERPIKHVGNAGTEPLLVFVTVDGAKQMLTVEPGQGLDVPLDDDELLEYDQRQKDAADAPPVEIPVPLEERLVVALAAKAPDTPVTASELLAIIKGA